MNAAQKKILYGAMAAVIVTMLFPPHVFEQDMGSKYGAGFAFLLAAPEYNGFLATINVPSLLTEWIGIAIVAGLLWLIKRG